MKYKNIKNKVAFKEVLNNNGYDVDTDNNELKINSKKNKLAYIESTETEKEVKIKILDKDISIEEARKLYFEVSQAIDMYEYIKEKLDV